MQARIHHGPFLFRATAILVAGMLAADALWGQAGQLDSHATYPAPSSQVGASGLLNADEGLTILAAALESRHHADSRLDCSHLIHAIYERAGFPYNYANSSDLYDGAVDFQRVTGPQTGDLIVWRGHVGIVISADQHTFFSALRTGRGVESYDSRYWKKRGRPRFFRYLKENPTLSASNDGAGLKLTGLKKAGARETIPAVTVVRDDSVHRESLSTIPTSVDLPRVQQIHSSRPKPEDIMRALLPAYDGAAVALESQDLFLTGQRVVVFEKLTVRKVQFKRDQGWAEVQIDGAFPILAVGSDPRKRSERQHWGMVRNGRDTWELALPPDIVYVSRETAVRLVAHQLTALTDSDLKGNRERKVQLAEMLNVLLGPPSGARP